MFQNLVVQSNFWNNVEYTLFVRFLDDYCFDNVLGIVVKVVVKCVLFPGLFSVFLVVM